MTTSIPKLLTAADLLAMPDDGKRYELVRGELIEMPPPGIRHGVVTDQIGWSIKAFVRQHGLDFVSTSEAGIFIEQEPDTVIAPDYALIARDRIAAQLPERGYVAGLVPDLVVEVISPGYREAAASARAQTWLDAGARLVLVACIAGQEIVAHRDDGTVRRFDSNDTLTGEPVLSGFAGPVADIFTC